MLDLYIINFDNIVTTAIPWSKMALTTTRPRNRRQVLNDTANSVTIHDVRKEFSKQFEQLMPLKYCKSSEKVCPSGPPGLPGPTGAKVNVVGGEQRGRKGLKVPLDDLERPEKQERRVLPDREEKRETRENLGQKACRDREEKRETMAILGQKACREQEEKRETMEILGQKACREQEEKRETAEILGQMARRDREEQRETRESLGQRACRDGLAIPGNRRLLHK